MGVLRDGWEIQEMGKLHVGRLKNTSPKHHFIYFRLGVPCLVKGSVYDVRCDSINIYLSTTCLWLTDISSDL